VLFSELARTLAVIEATSERTTLARQLAQLLRRASPEEAEKVAYFVTGDLRPPWEGVELGVGEKLLMRAVAKAVGVSVDDVEALYKRLGDVGEAAAQLARRRAQRSSSTLLAFAKQQAKPLTVSEVYDTLLRVAKTSGAGAQELKVSLLASLFSRASPEEARYIARFVVGKLRLGVAEMTLLDALSEAYGVPRQVLEKAFAKYPDIGRIARLVAEGGEEALAGVRITVGVPVLPMLAQRLTAGHEVLARLGGVCACEFKYDGERAQIHKRGRAVKIFSRKLEDITHAYPDVVSMVLDGVKAGEAIVEGEIVAYNPDTGELLPFQELMHRRRKHNVAEAMEEYPVKLFLFG